MRDVQAWMQAVIMHPEGVQSGSRSALARSALHADDEEITIEHMLLPSSSLSSQRRIEVYANAYYARLLECLRDEFPALVALLGEETFNVFAFEYLQSYPSSSYTLADLGRSFHQFLAENRKTAMEDLDSTDQDKSSMDLMVDLALLERTYSEVFSGAGIENGQALSGEALSAVPPELVGSIRLSSAPCVRLLQLNSRAHEYAIAVRKSSAPILQIPEQAPTFLVITRLNYVVRTIAIEPEEYLLLKHLIDDVCLEQAIANLAEHFSLSDEQLNRKLADWFLKWGNDRLFVAFRTSNRTAIERGAR